VIFFRGVGAKSRRFSFSFFFFTRLDEGYVRKALLDAQEKVLKKSRLRVGENDTYEGLYLNIVLGIRLWALDCS